MKEKLSAAGSVIAAALASSCCWGPLFLAGLGASGAGFASALAPFRPYLNGLTVAFLAGAWYLMLRKKPAASAAGSCCASEVPSPADSGRRRNVVLLSGVTLFALAMLFFPQISAALSHSRANLPVAAAPAGDVETVMLQIEGMTCEACEPHLRDALLQVPGVVSAEVSYRSSSARVTYHRGRVSIPHLEQAAGKTGYRITFTYVGPPTS